MPDMKDSAATRLPETYRQSLPPGAFGSEEGRDPMLPAPQYVHTVAYSENETRDPSLAGSVASLRSADVTVSLREYETLGGRREPMPRTAGDELYLEGYGRNVADQRMSDDNAMAGPSPKAEPDKCDLYGDNRYGMLHNKNAHPGFKSVQSSIAKREGISKDRAGAILAASSRNASKAAHKKNPRLNRVKG